ncbi:MAG TPA: LysR family transcriptional regulator [Steroidobacteraceae bacterium]|nr:LysR family transcriptional regulator [Steroidobacteraceae bacterium]HEV2443552.1 LysR family transcriptional regulator [Steroidobacteraceae bacterium]
MDTELARTFLSVVAAGSFVEASQRLHVTQSTVSARIQRLEEQLGAELFVRNKAGTTLTPAGRQFQHHAIALTRTVEQARQEIGNVVGFRTSLTVGGRIALWEGLLQRSLPLITQLAPDVAVRAHLFGFEEDLMEALIDGRDHIGLMYNPQSRPGLTVEPLLEDRLVMVSTRESPEPAPDSHYVYVDWGPEFFAHHSLAFPTFTGAALTVNVGWLGLQHILSCGGSGYFPVRQVREHELTGRLHRVPGAPEFRLPVYLCYPTKSDSEALTLALDTIRRVAAETQ